MDRPRKHVATDLSRFIDAALARRGLTHNEFRARVNMSPASVSCLKLRIQTNAPDRELVQRWAAVLELTPSEENELYDKVQLAYSPLYVQRLVSELRLRSVV
jgi:hypothetical protein